MRLKRERYTKAQLTGELKIPAGVIERLFPAPVTLPPRRGGHKPQVFWTARQVRDALRDPRVIRAAEKAEKSGRDDESAQIQNYLRSFDITRMRDEARELKRRFVIHAGQFFIVPLLPAFSDYTEDFSENCGWMEELNF